MLVTIVVILLVLGLLLYAVRFLPIDGRVSQLLQAVMIVVAAILILQAAGLI